MVALGDLSFDEADANLFLVDDVRLKADALRHSVVPRLRALLGEAIASVQAVYGIDALEDSTVSCFPNFRLRRERELVIDYPSAYVGLGGRRTKARWHGFARNDGREVQILPFRLGIHLTADGIHLHLENHWLTGLTDDSHRRLFRFHLDNEAIIHSLCYACGMGPQLYWGDSVPPIATLADHYAYMAENQIFANDYASVSSTRLPVSSGELAAIVDRFTGFFPIYDSYIQLAKGQAPRFRALIDRLNEHIAQATDEEEDDGKVASTVPGQVRRANEEHAREAARQRTQVMPARRWRVFQRDDWRCVSCGRGAQHEAILQVDHIVPRSLGGGDDMDNLQTLCQLCNAGKSNRDSTDLRRRT